MLPDMPSAISTYLPTAKDQTVPASSRHNHSTVFDFGVDTAVIVRSILLHLVPNNGQLRFRQGQTRYLKAKSEIIGTTYRIN
jgi:hypothetical protein